ncbi:signal peptidase I [Corynebacterium terpenotabidum]|uniref:Signal peptidase I n=1 Tax=Corynebacterium terpenotabidum Y-11 TaxID=1200352 RepID=S4XMP1_9CORY|nr:signal peptidase I [Corynebacterium terpenotabidum]AGP31933.1 Signal peptidase I [Corynebacterium terpenotabidum Y-11]
MSEATETATGDAVEKKSRPAWVEYLVTIVVALLILGLVNTFVGRLYQIPSESMEPTLVGCDGCTGDRIAVDKVSYRFDDPQAGDVVVFVAPEGWEEGWTPGRSDNPVIRLGQNVLSAVGLLAPDEYTLVKRVIATEGQTVQCLEGDSGVMVDGQRIDESYILDPPAYQVDPSTGSEACGGQYFGPVTVPDDSLWVMGDNRTNSKDSRYHQDAADGGFVPVDDVVGQARFKVWPLSRIGGID